MEIVNLTLKLIKSLTALVKASKDQNAVIAAALMLALLFGVLHASTGLVKVVKADPPAAQPYRSACQPEGDRLRLFVTTPDPESWLLPHPGLSPWWSIRPVE